MSHLKWNHLAYGVMMSVLTNENADQIFKTNDWSSLESISLQHLSDASSFDPNYQINSINHKFQFILFYNYDYYAKKISIYNNYREERRFFLGSKRIVLFQVPLTIKQIMVNIIPHVDYFQTNDAYCQMPFLHRGNCYEKDLKLEQEFEASQQIVHPILDYVEDIELLECQGIYKTIRNFRSRQTFDYNFNTSVTFKFNKL